MSAACFLVISEGMTNRELRRRMTHLLAVATIAVCCSATAALSYDAQLGWAPVAGVAGYKVYVRQSGSSFGAGSDVGNPALSGDGQIHSIVNNLTAGVTNYFAVSAYNSAGSESALSNELSLMVSATPTPTVSGAATAGTAVPTATSSATSTATATRTATSTAPPAPTASSTATVTAGTAIPTATPSPTTTRAPTAAGATIWGPTATPAVAADSDASAVELGVKFTSDVNGLIMGIRYYKSTTNTGTHSGSLWSNAGVLLATATFTNETASGWQQVDFANPVAITANSVYIASYHTNVGHYASDELYFSAAGVDSPPLHALRNGVSGANGVYVYGASAFPTSTFNSSNYWVDVVFAAAASATPTSTAPAPQTSTPTASLTSTATRTATNTAPPTSTSTATRTASASSTATASSTLTPPPTATSSASPSATATVTRTATSTATNTAPPTSTSTATRTASASSTATATYTLTPPPTATSSASPSATATATYTASATNTAQPTGTSTATHTVSPSSTASATYTATELPANTATATQTATAVATDAAPPSATPTPTITLAPTATASSTPTPTATPVAVWKVSLPTGVSIVPGSTVSVPATIDQGSGVQEFALRIEFDPAVVAVQGVALSSKAGPGDLNADFATPGDLTLSATLRKPMTGGGSLVDISLAAVGSCPSSTALSIDFCELDAGAIGCQPIAGSAVVSCGVGGRVKHWRSGAPVAGTTVAMSDTQSPSTASYSPSTSTATATTTTDELGQFAFDDTTTGSWRIEPQKSGEWQGAVTAYDAALALQAAAGGRQFDSMEALACDVTANGSVTALDGARILQFVVGNRPRLEVADKCGSDWAFVPAPAAVPNQQLLAPVPSGNTCRPGGIILNPLLGDAPQQDFTAVLFGDCSGNWSPAQQGSALLRAPSSVRVRLGTARVRAGGERLVPLYVESTAPVVAVDARVAADPAAVLTEVRLVGAARDAMVAYQSDARGGIALAVASPAPIAADGGPLAVLVFKAPQHRRGATLVRMLSAAVDEGAVSIGN